MNEKKAGTKNGHSSQRFNFEKATKEEIDEILKRGIENTKILLEIQKMRE